MDEKWTEIVALGGLMLVSLAIVAALNLLTGYCGKSESKEQTLRKYAVRAAHSPKRPAGKSPDSESPPNESTRHHEPTERQEKHDKHDKPHDRHDKAAGSHHPPPQQQQQQQQQEQHQAPKQEQQQPPIPPTQAQPVPQTQPQNHHQQQNHQPQRAHQKAHPTNPHNQGKGPLPVQAQAPAQPSGRDESQPPSTSPASQAQQRQPEAQLPASSSNVEKAKKTPESSRSMVRRLPSTETGASTTSVMTNASSGVRSISQKPLKQLATKKHVPATSHGTPKNT